MDAGEEHQVLQALRQGDESAFERLIALYHPAMVRVARGFVREDAAAEDAAQDTWLAVLQGTGRFEGRGSLKSWIFAILVNRAKTRAARDARTVAFSALAGEETTAADPSVEPSRFQGPDGRFPGGWLHPPLSWSDDPEARVLGAETLNEIRDAIDGLPPAQRTVVLLRDYAGHDSESICNELGISETNMRVLLHRGRSKVRRRLEHLFNRAAERAPSKRS